MDMEKKQAPVGAEGGGDEKVEQAEVKIADLVEELAQLLRGLHKKNEHGDVKDVTEDEDAKADKADKIREITGQFAKLGATEEEVKKLADSLAELAAEADKDEEPPAEDEDEVDESEAPEGDEDEQPDDDQTAEDEDDEEGEEFDQLTQDALKACGYDSESPEFQRAFAEGVKYGERKEKEEPTKLDREHESEGEERRLEGAQDKMLSRIAALENEAAIRTAIDECAKIIGKARVAAFDSADDVYLAALKQKGVSVRSISKKNARQLYLGVLKGESLASKREVAADSALRNTPDIAKGINVKVS